MKLLKKNLKIIYLFVFSFILSLVYLIPVQAQGLKDAKGILGKIGETAGYDLGKTDPADIVTGVIKTFLSVLGIIFMILTVYGGYLWMTARGNDEQVKKAKDLIVDGIIGFIIVIGAYAITVFIVSRLTTAAGFKG